LFRHLQTYHLTIFKTGHNRLIDLTANELAKRPTYYLPQSSDGYDN
jgi:hypothetical protein